MSNLPFRADDESVDPEVIYSTSLDLTGTPAGSYYFNKENNFNYTKNWFNYSRFRQITSDSIVSELVQYSSPSLSNGSLDTLKTYGLPSTTMTPQWIARIETGTNTLNNGWSGVDFAGNTYLVANYTDLNNALVYNQDGSLAFTKLNNGLGSSSICLAKFNSIGNAIWALRIKTNIAGEQTWATSCVTNNTGKTFIAGVAPSGSILEFENPSGTIALSFTMPFGAGFIVAFAPTGTLDWLTLVQPAVHQMYVDNQEIENLYGLVSAPGGANSGSFFYDGVPLAPTLVLSTPVGSAYTIAKWRASSGLFQWATYLEGNQIFNWGDVGSNSSILRPVQSLTTDPEGNLIIIGSYVGITAIKNAATPANPIAESSELTLPPDSNLIIWNPREENRNWSGVALSNNAQYMVATVQNGLIYVSSDFGVNWTPRATIQQWSSVWCSDTGQYMIATVMDSVIYASSDFGVTWSITLGEGSNAHSWIAVNGKGDGTELVACAQSDRLFYSNNQGATWSQSTSIVANWIDVAFKGGRFVALVQNGQAYSSTDGGLTWVLLGGSPVKNWSAITQGTQFLGYLAAVENGELYSVDVTGTTWTVVNSTPRMWTDIAVDQSSSSWALATEFDGAIYIAQATFENTWIPTTIPRNWNKVALSSSYGVASVSGGQLYVSSQVEIVDHTFIIKYDPAGTALWANYVNCPSSSESSNFGFSITTQSNGNIVASGILPGDPIRLKSVEFFDSSDFNTPIKILDNNQDGARYLACWSPQGTPLWANKLSTGNNIVLTAMNTDPTDNIYVLAYSPNQTSPLQLYQPTNQLAYSSAWPVSLGRIILLKYYPNGFVQSVATLESSIAVECFGIRVIGAGLIYFSGWFSGAGTLTAYSSDRNIPSSAENCATSSCYAVKYSSSNVSWITFPDPGYNLVFDPQFTIGGSTRYLNNGNVGDGDIEIWGGKTGLPPSAVDTNDLNASVISYLGHQPGYTIPIVEGLQSFSPKVYNYLVVGLSEPSFPTMDPQPVSPTTIPYGFLPIFAKFPNYATGLVLNNTLNDETNIMLSAIGTIPSNGLPVTGVASGDRVRILMYTPSKTAYVTLTVLGFIDSQTLGNVQTAIVFEESTRYLASIIGSATNANATLMIVGNERYAPMFWQPVLVTNGTLKLIVQLYPK